MQGSSARVSASATRAQTTGFELRHEAGQVAIENERPPSCPLKGAERETREEVCILILTRIAGSQRRRDIIKDLRRILKVQELRLGRP
jgi:hypothetical protein